MIPAILAALGEASAGAGAAAGAAGAGEAAASIGGVTKQIGQLQTATTALAPSMQKFVSAITLLPNQLLQAKAVITSTADTFVAALAAPIDTIKHLGDSVSRFVQLTNPAQVTMFNYKLENAMASLGRVFEPILDSLGRAADRVNSAFSKLGPSLDVLGTTMADLVDSLTQDIVPAVRELSPLLQTQAGLWQSMAKVIGATSLPILKVTEALHRMGISLGPLGALFPGGFDENAPNTVAARRPKQTTAEQLQRDSAIASLMASSGAAPERKTETILDQILTFLNRTFGPRALAKFITDLAQAIRDATPRNPARVGAEAAGDEVAEHLPLLR